MALFTQKRPSALCRGTRAYTNRHVVPKSIAPRPCVGLGNFQIPAAAGEIEGWRSPVGFPSRSGGPRARHPKAKAEGLVFRTNPSPHKGPRARHPDWRAAGPAPPVNCGCVGPSGLCFLFQAPPALPLRGMASLRNFGPLGLYLERDGRNDCAKSFSGNYHQNPVQLRMSDLGADRTV